MTTKEGGPHIHVSDNFIFKGKALVVEEGGSGTQELVEKRLVIGEKAARDLVRRGLGVFDLMDVAIVEAEDLRAGATEQDGRVRGDDELRVRILADCVVKKDE